MKNKVLKFLGDENRVEVEIGEILFIPRTVSKYKIQLFPRQTLRHFVPI